MHHLDLTPGVMTGLAWYYLLAAMLNAAAAAYVAYMEIVSEGASRAGLAPRTRRLPDWLVIAFGTLYGLATLVILGRHLLGPAALRVAYVLCALANGLVAIAAGAAAAVAGGLHLGEVRRVGPRGDGHQGIGQGAEAVGDPQRLGPQQEAAQDYQRRHAVERAEGDDQPVREPPRPRRQPRT